MLKYTIETYGCRMNICDSEVVISLLKADGHQYAPTIDEVDVVILNSCSVREDGHDKIFERLNLLDEQGFKGKIIVAGCFASMISADVFTQYSQVAAIVNPNSYRSLPRIFYAIEQGKHGIYEVQMDNKEIYAGIVPTRLIEDTTTAAITVMKGCDQFCTYCIEPFTRGRETCKPMAAIIEEAKDIARLGFKEITLVGHIIDKYSASENGEIYDFADLLEKVAEACPNQRIKFLSSHPLHFSAKTAEVMRKHSNIMAVVHLPVQSGCDRILKLMHRGYTTDDYRRSVEQVRQAIPDISIITDVMTGFCTESEQDFDQTLQLIRDTEPYDINIFCFSMRKHTRAYDTLSDDVPAAEKMRRKTRVMDLREAMREKYHRSDIGRQLSVLVERIEDGVCFGRDNRHRSVMFPDTGNMINDLVKVEIITGDAQNMEGRAV